MWAGSLLLANLVLAASCAPGAGAPEGPAGSSVETGCLDIDGDGVGCGDCDDLLATTHPEAAEVCNGQDDDCDGLVDEEPADGVLLYRDEDGDGWGDAAQSRLGCVGDDGWSVAEGDCDDQRPDVAPGQAETCNEIDDDCDGLVDADDPEIVDALACSSDHDGDEWGDPSEVVAACVCPDGWTEQAGDCSPGDGATHPRGLDVCGDGIDGDCDGFDKFCPIEGVTSASTADSLIVGAAGEYLGRRGSVSGQTDINGDGLPDVAMGAWGGLGGRGRVYVFSGTELPSSGSAEAAATYTFDGWDEDARLGSSVALLADADGDRIGELVAGAAYEDTVGDRAGAVYAVRGLRLPGLSGLDDADAVWQGEGAGDNAGYGVTAAGDVDGDGLSDFVVGAGYSDCAAENGGAVYLVLGGWVPGVRSLAAADARFCGERAGGRMGLVAGAGAQDTDDDGYDDFLVGADEGLGDSRGTAYLFRGAGPGAELLRPSATISGAAPGDQLSRVAMADVDGDGGADLVLGAEGALPGGLSGTKGRMYVVYAKLAAAAYEVEAAAGTWTSGAEYGSMLGEAVCSLGDINGDGAPELGVRERAGTDETLRLAYGWLPILGEMSSGDATLLAASIVGSSATEAFALSCGSLGDVAGRGADAFFVGAENHDGGGQQSGAVYLWGGMPGGE